ncbi:MAG: DUF1858 domain-containing protein [Syntrophales bacterium]|jgi:hypothetical protein|nr:DUF1858 domain-containing protein [Syntrophales bacterium]MCK9527947.1 DUF1858 domain-containing protein [Syntrophales bacterium]MDX9921878.1 hypothetical protein [Syntrophales bacterium]
MNDEKNPETRPGQRAAERADIITPEMTILDIISRHRETERIFKRLEAELGVCVCCRGLFLTLREAAEQYGFPVDSVMTEINDLVHNRTG